MEKKFCLVLGTRLLGAKMPSSNAIRGVLLETIFLDNIQNFIFLQYSHATIYLREIEALRKQIKNFNLETTLFKFISNDKNLSCFNRINERAFNRVEMYDKNIINEDDYLRMNTMLIEKCDKIILGTNLNNDDIFGKLIEYARDLQKDISYLGNA